MADELDGSPASTVRARCGLANGAAAAAAAVAAATAAAAAFWRACSAAAAFAAIARAAATALLLPQIIGGGGACGLRRGDVVDVLDLVEAVFVVRHICMPACAASDDEGGGFALLVLACDVALEESC